MYEEKYLMKKKYQYPLPSSYKNYVTKRRSLRVDLAILWWRGETLNPLSTI